LISKEDYRHDLEGALRVLEGGSTDLRTELEKRMADAAATLQFEVAARLRDQLAGLAELQNQQIARVTSMSSRCRGNRASTRSRC
jgi:excinuclease ABC subunit C